MSSAQRTGDRTEPPHRGVERIATILKMTASSPAGLRLADLARGLDAPRSSVHSLLKGLVSADFLSEQDGRYVIGPGVGRLLTPRRTASLIDLAGEEVEALNRLFDETTLLGTVVDDEVVYLIQAESSHSIRYTAKLGEPRSMYPTSTGKLVLSSRDDAWLASYRDAMPAVEAAEFDRQIGVARRTGLAFNREETVRGVTAVGAGVHDKRGDTIAALVVVGPVYRMGDHLEEMAPQVRAAADRISQRLAKIDLDLA